MAERRRDRRVEQHLNFQMPQRFTFSAKTAMLSASDVETRALKTEQDPPFVIFHHHQFGGFIYGFC